MHAMEHRKQIFIYKEMEHLYLQKLIIITEHQYLYLEKVNIYTTIGTILLCYIGSYS